MARLMISSTGRFKLTGKVGPWRARIFPDSRPRRTAALAMGFLMAVSMVFPLKASPAHAASFQPHVNPHQGFDRCGTTSRTAAQAWWDNSYYWTLGVYIGGATATDVGCFIPTASWVQDISSQGWGLVFIWDGLQAPCSSNGNRFSSNTTTAYNQGYQEAGNAVAKVINDLQVGSVTVLYIDLEGNYDPSNTSCKAAVNSFLHGWHAGFVGTLFVDGVYSSSSKAIKGLVDAACWNWSGGCINQAWMAAWDGRNTVWGDSYIGDNYWHSYRRHHQFRGGHSHTIGGYSLTVDDDCNLGKVAGGAADVSTSTDAQTAYPTCDGNSSNHLL